MTSAITIWEARGRTGLSREKVAWQLDPPITAKTLERWEKGESGVKGYRLAQLATVYGVPVKRLVAT